MSNFGGNLHLVGSFKTDHAMFCRKRFNHVGVWGKRRAVVMNHLTQAHRCPLMTLRTVPTATPSRFAMALFDKSRNTRLLCRTAQRINRTECSSRRFIVWMLSHAPLPASIRRRIQHFGDCRTTAHPRENAHRLGQIPATLYSTLPDSCRSVVTRQCAGRLPT